MSLEIQLIQVQMEKAYSFRTKTLQEKQALLELVTKVRIQPIHPRKNPPTTYQFSQIWK